MTAPDSKPGLAATNPPPRQEVKREVVELVKMVALFLVLFLFLKTFVVEGYEVQGPSMDPTLHDRERILVWKLPHMLQRMPMFGGIEAVAEGDIVVFKSSVESNKRYIKRVVAKGPEALRDNTVIASTHGDDEHVRVRFRGGKLYVDGEPVDEPYLTELERRSYDRDEAVLRAGQYYVLGDHRSVSKDSRSFGPIKDNQIIGRAWLRFWPLSQFGLL